MTYAVEVEDPRRRRTREDLQRAFLALVLAKRYHLIRVGDVLTSSGVSRSTFYEHFSGKDELLAASLEHPFQVLASLVGERADVNAAQRMIEHFWMNRTLAQTLFEGAALRIVRRTLVLHVETALTHEQRSRLRIPVRLAAHGLADGLLSPIIAWLNGEGRCTAHELAATLQLTSCAYANALLAGMKQSAGQIDPRSV